MLARVFLSAGESAAFRSPMRTHCPHWPWETSATNVCSPSPWHWPISVESVCAGVVAAPDGELPGVSLVPAPPSQAVVWAVALASPAPLLPVLPLSLFVVPLCPLAGSGALAPLSWRSQQL